MEDTITIKIPVEEIPSYDRYVYMPELDWIFEDDKTHLHWMPF